MPTPDRDRTATTWLLDVDGVVNVLRDGRREDPRLSQARVFSPRTGHSYVICWRPRLLDDIRRANRFVTVHWASTWCDGGDTDSLNPALGLTFPAAFGSRPYNLTHDDQKIAAALAVLDAGKRLIWTDDTVVPPALRRFPEFREAELAGRALLIAPNERWGLTNRHMALIKQFTRAGESDTTGAMAAAARRA
jgi:hypothetical protein